MLLNQQFSPSEKDHSNKTKQGSVFEKFKQKSLTLLTPWLMRKCLKASDKFTFVAPKAPKVLYQESRNSHSTKLTRGKCGASITQFSVSCPKHSWTFSDNRRVISSRDGIRIINEVYYRQVASTNSHLQRSLLSLALFSPTVKSQDSIINYKQVATRRYGGREFWK